VKDVSFYPFIDSPESFPYTSRSRFFLSFFNDKINKSSRFFVDRLSFSIDF